MNLAIEHAPPSPSPLQPPAARAAWREISRSTWALVAGDDGEALIVLTRRFEALDPAKDLWVVDATDRCYVGLENAKAGSVRDLIEPGACQ
jgi:hypothetical protein